MSWNQPVGHFFDVITRGHGTMYSYASRISARLLGHRGLHPALQLSQHAVVAGLPAADQGRLEDLKP